MYICDSKRPARVRDVFYGTDSNGMPVITDCELFDYLDIPGMTDNNKILSLMLYNDCSEKIISPLIKDFVATSGKVDFDLVGQAIQLQYKYKWTALYDSIMAEYNPVENYNMTETETSTKAGNKQQTGKNSGASEVTGNTELNSDSGIYGFNSATPHGDKNNSQTETVDNKTSQSSDYSQNEDNNESGSRLLTRVGNIGVTTTQQMLQQQREVARYNYLSEVIADIAGFISLKIW